MAKYYFVSGMQKSSHDNVWVPFGSYCMDNRTDGIFDYYGMKRTLTEGAQKTVGALSIITTIITRYQEVGEAEYLYNSQQKGTPNA